MQTTCFTSQWSPHDGEGGVQPWRDPGTAWAHTGLFPTPLVWGASQQKYKDRHCLAPCANSLPRGAASA